jgi:hypothetical protein
LALLQVWATSYLYAPAYIRRNCRASAT